MTHAALPFDQAPRRSLRPRLGAEAVFRRLLHVSKALAGQLDFQTAIQAVSEELAHILPHDHLDVCILRRDEHVAYEAGAHTAWSLNERPLPVTGSPIRLVLLGEAPFLLTGDAMADPRFHFEGAFSHPIFEEALRSRIHVPLLVRGEIIGAFSCSSREADFYETGDVPFAQHVADMLAPYFFALRVAEDTRLLAIEEAEGRAREEGLREGALRLTEELERERQRIGMDLHDMTLADLTRISRRVERLRAAESLEPDVLEPIAAGLDRCIRELREIIDDARPNVLQLFGLADGIEDFLERALDAGGANIAWRFRDESEGCVDRLEDSLRVALFRIVQEAVNNAAHHAEPSLIEVDIRREARGGDAHLTIEIRDDGIGFASLQQRKRVGGIRNMQTRARLVGASFQIARRTDARGTLVALSLRLPSLGETTGDRP
ncbi:MULTISPECIES: GAF domain-containing sensor histidine kinase [unclassified Aureimonas]|uniref:GAF domain-containing sensor histidine kinase n=1 Tax=unclassified Aureimonas TaxID=2615206 RepID=UPI0009E99320|nr:MULTISPECIES: GAF domain-containing protein [unclassified Aureimonas]